mgnify:CR=1 FL=1
MEAPKEAAGADAWRELALGTLRHSVSASPLVTVGVFLSLELHVDLLRQVGGALAGANAGQGILTDGDSQRCCQVGCMDELALVILRDLL